MNAEYEDGLKAFSHLIEDIHDDSIPLERVIDRHASDASERLKGLLMRNFRRMRDAFLRKQNGTLPIEGDETKSK